MSDPSAIQIPVGQALTSDMLLGLKPSAPKSRSYRLNVAPLNKAVFAPGDQIIIELPTGRKGTWLDQSQSYLKFSVQVSSTAAANALAIGSGVYVENTAYSFIQRLDVYNSSNLLETINEYGQLCNFLVDTSLTQSDKAGLSGMIGCNPNTVAINTGVGYVQNASTTEIVRAGDRSGMPLASVQTAAGIGNAIPYTFTLPLLSGIIGINASKMLPIGKLNAPIRCEFYLASNDDAIYYGTAGAGAVWQVLNVEFCACYVELQDDNFDMPMQQGVPQFISTNTYRQASTYLPAATSGEFTTLVPFRCASLTALYARFRNQATSVQGANATAAYRKSCSINPNLSNFYFRIGSSIYPNKPIYLINGSLVGTGSEGYAELIKSFHALSSSIGNTAITVPQYNVCATAVQGWSAAFAPGNRATTQDTHNNGFCVGLECQSFSNRNDTILSGISTLNSQIFFTGVINTGATAGGGNNFNYTVDFFSQMVMILVIIDGVMSAKF
jgi:hypothetical protein